MKCVRNTLTGRVYRDTDTTADTIVDDSGGIWVYASKQEWKDAGRKRFVHGHDRSPDNLEE